MNAHRNDFSREPVRSPRQQKITTGFFAASWRFFTPAIWWLVLGGLLFGPAARGVEPALTEYQVKALCLVNFARYTEWPAAVFSETNAPLVIGIIGESRLRTSLQSATEGKNIAGHNVVIRDLNTEVEYDKCQILFVSASETKHLPEILSRVKNKPILTVGETEPFLQQGGIIDFAMRSGRVRFDIDLNAAHHSGLQISSKVLSLADEVRGKP